MVSVALLLLGVPFMLRGSGAQSVTQLDSHVTVSERAPLELRCNYYYGGTPYLFWYVQYPNQGLQFLLKYEPGKTVVKGIKGFEAEFKKSETSFHLKKASIQWSDTAEYFCALRDKTTASKIIFGKGTQLHVLPNIRNPEPSVYQMKDPKFRNTSICLFTDFDSQINVTQGSEAMDSEVFYSGKTVLDMRSIDFKSNGAVAWSKKTDFECTGVFQEKVSLPSSDHSCNAKLVEKSFETDMNLNFQNLIVIGLRILLLKVAGYNVFMTLRLWSS